MHGVINTKEQTVKDANTIDCFKLQDWPLFP